MEHRAPRSLLICAVPLLLVLGLTLGCGHRRAVPPATSVPTGVAPAEQTSAAVQVLTAADLAQGLRADGQVTLRTVYFKTGEPELLPDADDALSELLLLLQSNLALTLEVGVHSDPRGSSAFNQKITEQRADSIVQWFVYRGVSPGRLIPIGYGEQELLPCGDGVECYEQCRRVELTIPARR